MKNKYDLQEDPEFGKLQAAQKELMSIDYDLRTMLFARLGEPQNRALWKEAGIDKEINQVALALVTSRGAVLSNVRVHLRKAMMQSKAIQMQRPSHNTQPTIISRIILDTIRGWFVNYNRPTTTSMTENTPTPTPPELIHELREINENLSALGPFCHNGISRKAIQGLRTTLHIMEAHVIDTLNECSLPEPGVGINIRGIAEFQEVERKAQELKFALIKCQQKLINM